MWILAIPLLLVWASVLMIIAHRLVHDVPFFAKPSCPACRHSLSYSDTIPLISYIFLSGRCRHCKAPISFAYFTIELLTPLTILPLWWYFPWYVALSYSFFFSALLITVYSDATTMLISRLVTLFLIPIPLLLSYTHILPISIQESIAGAIGGYVLLKAVAYIFLKFAHKEGLGQGDVDLLAFIGAWTGLVGVWATLLLASTAGSLIGIIYMIATGRMKDSMSSDNPIMLPFGPFLALSAICFIYANAQYSIASLLIG